MLFRSLRHRCDPDQQDAARQPSWRTREEREDQTGQDRNDGADGQDRQVRRRREKASAPECFEGFGIRFHAGNLAERCLHAVIGGAERGDAEEDRAAREESYLIGVGRQFI